MTVKVALIGYGAIAQDLFIKVQDDPYLTIKQVLVRHRSCEIVKPLLCSAIEVISSIDDLDDDIDFVLECAGHEALCKYGEAVLRRGIDLGVLSAGALSDINLDARLRQAAHQSGSKIIVVPGAIGGIDAISAVGKTGLTAVQYTGRKAPLSWKGTPAENVCDLENLSEPFEVYVGAARDAARIFPKNANVVATVALAGIGFDETLVRLIADPSVSRNTHKIEAHGDNVSFSFETCSGTLPDNPRTSALTSQSAYRILKMRSDSFFL